MDASDPDLYSGLLFIIQDHMMGEDQDLERAEMETQEHWENIYSNKDHRQVSWFTDRVSTSLDRISSLNLDRGSKIIDVGGGASTLVDDLLSLGFKDVTVLDVSASALAIAIKRVGETAGKVTWLAENLLTSGFGGKTFDLWHDRAVLHFLTREEERAAYHRQLSTHLSAQGHVIISVFAEDGPIKCSGVEIRRYGESDLMAFLGFSYEPVAFGKTVHRTPGGADQIFSNLVARKKP